MRPLLTPGRGSGTAPRKRSAGTRVHHLRRTTRERRAHLVERGDEIVLEAGREGARLRMRVAGLQGPPFLDPFRQAARRGCAPPRRHRRARSTRPAPRHRGRARHRRRSACRRRGRARSSPWPASRASAACAAGLRRDRRSVSMSKNTAPGMCLSRNSAAPVRPALGRCQEASITPRLGSPSSAASSAVVTKLREGMGFRSA